MGKGKRNFKKHNLKSLDCLGQTVSVKMNVSDSTSEHLKESEKHGEENLYIF